MAFSPFKIIKSLLISAEGTLTPSQIEIIPAGSVSTKTTLTSSQTTNKTITLPDAADTLVGKATTDSLTNKSLVDNSTSIVDSGDATKKILFDAAGTTSTSTTLTGSQTSNRVLTLPDATDTLIGKATTDTLTNKTYDAAGTGNVLSNVANSNVAAAAAIAYSKLATLNTGSIVAGNAGVPTATAVSGDITIGATGVTAIGANKVTLGMQATLAANTAIANATGSTATPTAVPMVSTNTASAIVIRDGSGNFSAGTVTAALTGTASGNTTYSANNHGVVLSSGTNAMTVVAPDASTAKTLISGGASADPSWGTLAIGGGGTGQTSKAAAFDALQPMTTGGDIIYGGASGTGTRLANGSSGQFLQSAGGTSAPIWAAPTIILAPPTIQKFTSGSGTYNKNYTFVITSGSATVGATYTNNSITYTVYATVASATQVVMSGSGAPTATGTLTKASGTGDSTLTFSQVIAPLYLITTIIGGGGGGAGGGTTGISSGADGVDTTFGSNTASKGLKGLNTGGSAGGVGGTVTLGTGTAMQTQQGGNGCSGSQNVVAGGTILDGGIGGNSGYAGGGIPAYAANSINAIPNTGGGGAGGSTSATTAADYSGAGGGAGAFLKALIASPSATYSYAVGGGGSGGAGGTGGTSGSNGAAGIVLVEEYYQ